MKLQLPALLSVYFLPVVQLLFPLKKFNYYLTHRRQYGQVEMVVSCPIPYYITCHYKRHLCLPHYVYSECCQLQSAVITVVTLRDAADRDNTQNKSQIKPGPLPYLSNGVGR